MQRKDYDTHNIAVTVVKCALKLRLILTVRQKCNTALQKRG